MEFDVITPDEADRMRPRGKSKQRYSTMSSNNTSVASKENTRKVNLITKQAEKPKEETLLNQQKESQKLISGSISRLYSPHRKEKPQSKATDQNLIFTIKMTPEEFNRLESAKQMYRTGRKVKL